MQSIRLFDSITDLPPPALTRLAGGGLFSDPIWWQSIENHACPHGARPGYLVLGEDAAAILPLLRTGRHVDALTTPYTCLYAPILTSAADAAGLAAALRDICRGGVPCRIDALPAEWPNLAAFTDGIRRAGLIPLRFDHFGNWSEDVRGTGWTAYLDKRPGALRQTIRRRLRQADAMAEARFDLFQTPETMDTAIAAFESVYARSWKDAEPFPSFHGALMRALCPVDPARQSARPYGGVLLGAALPHPVRIGVWSIGATPVAAQLWVVRDGTALVLKLAHDEAFKAHSPGTVLTAMMLRHLLTHETIQRIDFGRGDDAYKRGWASERRQRIGLLLADPTTLAGAGAILRHTIGRLLARRRPLP